MIDERLKSFWAGKTKEDVEKAVNKSMTMLMVVDFVCAISIYVALKLFLSSFWAECWMVAVYAYSLKSNIDLITPKCKEEMMKHLPQDNESTIDESKDKDIGEDEPKA